LHPGWGVYIYDIIIYIYILSNGIVFFQASIEEISNQQVGSLPKKFTFQALAPFFQVLMVSIDPDIAYCIGLIDLFCLVKVQDRLWIPGKFLELRKSDYSNRF